YETVDVRLAHTPRDQLAVLGAKVQYCDGSARSLHLLVCLRCVAPFPRRLSVRLGRLPRKGQVLCLQEGRGQVVCPSKPACRALSRYLIVGRVFGDGNVMGMALAQPRRRNLYEP